MPKFICFRINYCNSLLVGLPKIRLSPLQSVLNAAARLIARFPRTSHISAFMSAHLHWLPLIAQIQLKVLTLIYRSQLVKLPGIYVALSPCLPPPSLFVRYAHLTTMISLCPVSRHEPL